MPPKVVNASTITGPTMRAVACRVCGADVEWKRLVGSPIRHSSSDNDYLWCPTCQVPLNTNQIVPPGAVVLVFD